MLSVVAGIASPSWRCSANSDNCWAKTRIFFSFIFTLSLPHARRCEFPSPSTFEYCDLHGSTIGETEVLPQVVFGNKFDLSADA